MIPFIEPRVQIASKKDYKQFDLIAKRLGISGYAVLGKKFEKEESDSKKELIKHFSRMEIEENQVGKVRNLLPKVRHAYELVSIKTTSAKVAQWVIKDNRVDILVIPIKNMKEIITPQLANVAASNQTFFEIDLSFLLDKKKLSKSIKMRTLTRCLSILIKEKAPFIFTINIQTSLEFRDVRAIISLANLLGVPAKITKESLKKFNERILLNNRKLSEEFVTPGVWLKNEGKKEGISLKIVEREDLVEIHDNLDVPLSLQQISASTDKKERQRYLLFEIISNEKLLITEKDLSDLIWKHLAQLFGDVGSSRIGLYITHFDVEKKIGIIRCSHTSLEFLRATLSIISEISNYKAMIHVIKVSGTLRNLIKIQRKKAR